MEIEKACYNLVCSAVANCFKKIEVSNKHIRLKIVNRRIKFAKGKLLRVFCDCSDYFEYYKLRNRIIKYNEKFIHNINFQ